MKYKHTFQVKAPLVEVADFHSRAQSMAAITPPPIVVRMNHVPSVLGEGDRMDFTMWMGPLPIRWLAQIENVSPLGFSDRQLSGPFKTWLHRHSFAEVDENITEVIDEITAELRPQFVWGLVGRLMWLGLPLLFAYRGWKTRRLLEKA
jgi:ligand-binding SRPBCC domain-containing protein